MNFLHPLLYSIETINEVVCQNNESKGANHVRRCCFTMSKDDFEHSILQGYDVVNAEFARKYLMYETILEKWGFLEFKEKWGFDPKSGLCWILLTVPEWKYFWERFRSKFPITIPNHEITRPILTNTVKLTIEAKWFAQYSRKSKNLNAT